MKIKSLICLLAVMLSVFLHVSFDHAPPGGKHVLVTLDVCKTQAGGLVAHADMPCIGSECVSISLPEASDNPVIFDAIPDIPIITSRIDRPPIA
ncbi:MAG: hypothetical protein HZA20_05140 [Nitrospirae bacterium]|jgi:hypothetical protein|nr:hypothetical protein [Nitrospirota bacterium]